jgi:hypothetical protein
LKVAASRPEVVGQWEGEQGWGGLENGPTILPTEWAGPAGPMSDHTVRAWIRAEEVREARAACAHRWGVEGWVETKLLACLDH